MRKASFAGDANDVSSGGKFQLCNEAIIGQQIHSKFSVLIICKAGLALQEQKNIVRKARIGWTVDANVKRYA
jgi:hypothetical protein